MTPTEAFEGARDLLLRRQGDPEGARADFRWPALGDFNWGWDWFDVLAARRPEAPALVIVSETHGTTRTTYGEMAARSTQVARWLRDHGVERGDRILVMLPNVLPLWETVLAAIKLGAVVIPGDDPAHASRRRRPHRPRRGAPHGHRRRGRASESAIPSGCTCALAVGGAPSWSRPSRTPLAGPAALERVPTQASDPLLLYFTSGTTAKPKLVLHTHESYPVGHLSTMYWLGLREGDVHQNISSPGWAKHAWSSFFAPWNAGATILVHDAPRFSAKRTLEVVREQEVNTLCAPPTVWRMLILEHLGERPPRLRELASAGEPLNPEVIEPVRAAWGITIRDGYGQTETTAQIGNPPGLPVRLGSMGKPLPGYDVVLLDHQGGETDEGEVALRLSSRPSGLMVGYQDDPERTGRGHGGRLLPHRRRGPARRGRLLPLRRPRRRRVQEQ